MIHYTKHLIKLKNLYDGELETFLNQVGDVSDSKVNVLHIHGFSDYFFQNHVEKRFLDEGYNFFALDMRRNGRVRKQNQRIFFVKSVDEYFEEIEKSIQIIEQFSKQGIVLLGHSTGGLTATLFTSRFENKFNIKALILNSPFFDFYLTNAKKVFLKTFSILAPFFPYVTLPKPKGDSMGYTKSLHIKYFGEWNYDLNYKLEVGAPIRAGWVNAILKAQAQVKKGLHIKTPIFILHSDKSIYSQEYKPEVHSADVVLDVEDMKKYGKKIGDSVKFCEVKNAVHDVFLSRKEVRQNSLDKTIEWLSEELKWK